jgi:hypothetical protein
MSGLIHMLHMLQQLHQLPRGQRLCSRVHPTCHLLLHLTVQASGSH